MRDLYKLAGLQRFESGLETLRAAAKAGASEKDRELIAAILCDPEKKQAYDHALKTADLVENIDREITRKNKVVAEGQGGRSQPLPGQTDPARAVMNDSGRRLLTVYGVIFGLLFIAAGWLSLKGDNEHVDAVSPDEPALEIASEVEIIDLIRKRYHVTAETLNVRRGPGTHNRVVGQLKQYDNLVVEFPAIKEGWARIFTEGGVEGYVALAFVAPGDGGVAFRDYCMQSVTRPPTGQLTQTVAGGYQHLKVEAPLGYDVAVRLVSDTGNTALRGYIRAGQTYSFGGIPAGRYQLSVRAGKTFSAGCGLFIEATEGALFTRSLVFEPALLRGPDVALEISISLKEVRPSRH